MICESITRAVEGSDLNQNEAYSVMNEVMEGKATDAQIASLLTALRLKGETIEEITGFALAMREKAVQIRPKSTGLLDTCGTGGDKASTFNISTVTAFVVAGVGVPVAKHGNRAVSSACGSADVLNALGVKIDIAPELVSECIDEVGIGFLFAPNFHLAMKYAIGPRREIGIRTVFNILGPLTNPAGASYQVMGVFSPKLLKPLAEVLMNLGVKNAIVVHGADGLDEISNTGESRIVELKNGSIEEYTVQPSTFGLNKGNIGDLTCTNIDKNVSILKRILAGEQGAIQDVVLMNCAAALKVAEKVSDFKEGVEMAKESIDSGKAKKKLEKFIEFTNR